MVGAAFEVPGTVAETQSGHDCENGLPLLPMPKVPAWYRRTDIELSFSDRVENLHVREPYLFWEYVQKPYAFHKTLRCHGPVYQWSGWPKRELRFGGKILTLNALKEPQGFPRRGAARLQAES